jgi:hypothetical protein
MRPPKWAQQVADAALRKPFHERTLFELQTINLVKTFQITEKSKP